MFYTFGGVWRRERSFKVRQNKDRVGWRERSDWVRLWKEPMRDAKNHHPGKLGETLGHTMFVGWGGGWNRVPLQPVKALLLSTLSPPQSDTPIQKSLFLSIYQQALFLPCRTILLTGRDTHLGILPDLRIHVQTKPALQGKGVGLPKQVCSLEVMMRSRWVSLWCFPKNQRKRWGKLVVETSKC